MVELRQPPVQQPQKTAVTPASQALTEEEICIKIMERKLDGVMFHIYESDLFCLLELKGFKKMHEHQVKEENEELTKLKHEYIKKYCKIPKLKPETPIEWESNTEADISHEAICATVKDALEKYCDWETETLECLLKYKKDKSDKKMCQKLIEDVMHEIKFIGTIMCVLEEHNYHYDCVCEMSDYLCRMFK